MKQRWRMFSSASTSAAPAPVASPAPRSRVQIFARYGAVFLFLFALVIGLQLNSGAYSSDCGHHPDEAAHFVSALMIHDYVRSGFPAPMKYAEQYYLHYPKLAVGMWPPVFHVTLAAWMLLFGDSLASALVFLAFVTAVLATGVYVVLAPRYGGIAFAPAVILVGLPLMQANTNIVMADVLVALFGFASVAFLAHYLDYGETRDAVLYGLAVTLACDTKANGVAFVLAAPLAVVLSRRFDLLRKRGLYYAGVIFVVFALPFQIYSLALIQRNMYSAPGLSMLAEGTVAYIGLLWNSIGPVLGTIAIAGLASSIVGRKLSSLSLCCLAAILGVVVYHATAGFDPRYLVGALAPVVVFIPSGIVALTAPLRSRWAPTVAAALLTVVSGAIAFRTAVPRKPLGYNRVAEIIRTRAADAVAFLVSADIGGEGAFVAAIAEMGPRPKHYALRGTKTLAETTWFATNYRSLYETPDEMRRALATIPIDVLVVDETQPYRFPHQKTVIDTVRNNAGAWELLDRVRPGNGGATRSIAVYRQRGIPPGISRKFEVNMKYSRKDNLTVGK